MGSDEEDAINSELEFNQFEGLLAQKDSLHSIEITVPFKPEPLTVFYKILNSEESGQLPPLPDDVLEMEVADKVKAFYDNIEEKVWLMVEKAWKEGKLEKRYHMKREHWEEIKKKYPDVFNQIVGQISGTSQSLAKSFLTGQPTQN